MTPSDNPYGKYDPPQTPAEQLATAMASLPQAEQHTAAGGGRFGGSHNGPIDRFIHKVFNLVTTCLAVFIALTFVFFVILYFVTP